MDKAQSKAAAAEAAEAALRRFRPEVFAEDERKAVAAEAVDAALRRFKPENLS